MINKKKIFSFIFILIFFIMIISAANAADTNATNDIKKDTTAKLSPELDDSVAEVSQKDIVQNKTQKENIKETTKTQKNAKENTIKQTQKNSKLNTIKETKQDTIKETTVNNYQELYNKIEDIKANSTNLEEVINLNPGDYKITETIVWGNAAHTKKLTINGNNQTINGQDKYRFLHILKGSTLYLNNITIDHCFINRSTSTNGGGAIYNEGETTINNTIIKNTCSSKSTESFSGGAIRNDANLTIINSKIDNCHALNGSGGAIYSSGYYESDQYIESKLIIENSTINNCTTAPNGAGGAIYSSGYAVIENSNFTNNWARNGGALYIINETIKAPNGNYIIRNSNFINNTANWAGAIFNYRESNVTITSSNFTGNKASDIAGAIFGHMLVTNTTIINSTFTNNTALNGYGGAVKNDNNMTIINSTFINNSALNGSGGAIDSEHNMTIINSIFKNNRAKKAGAIVIYGENMNMTGLIIENNNATSREGAIFTGMSCNITINNSTIINNYDMNGTSVYLYTNSASNITISNTTINNTYKANASEPVNITSPIQMENLDIKEVRFTLEDKTITTTKDKKTNMVMKNYTFYNVGIIPANVKFSSLFTQNNDFNAIMDVSPVDTQIKIYSYNTTIKTLNNFTIIDATIKTINNKNIVGEIPVDFLINGVKVHNITTVDGKIYRIILPTDKYIAGEYNFTIQSKQTPIYNPSNATRTFKIKNRTATITINTNTPKVEGELTANITIRDETGLVNRGKIIVLVNGTQISEPISIDNGKTSIEYTLPSTIKAGKSDITVQYIDKYTNYAETTKAFNVEKYDINAEIKDITIKTLQNTTINTQVVDTQGNIITQDMDVEVFLGNVSVLNTTTRDSKLDITIPTDKYLAGKYDLTFKFKGNEKYNPLDKTVKLTIENRDAIVNIITNTPKTLEELEITVNVNENTTPLNGGYVVLLINSKTLKDTNNKTIKLPVENGVVKYNYKLLGLYKAGMHNITAKYINKYYNTAINTTKFNVLLTDITGELNPITAKTLEKITVNIPIVDENGNKLIKDTKVVVKLNGKTYQKMEIKDGQLAFNISSERFRADKTYTLKIILGKNSIYNNLSLNTTINMQIRKVNIEIEPIVDIHTTQLIPVNALIKDMEGNPIDGRVLFKINGKTQLDENLKPVFFEVRNGVVDATYKLPVTINRNYKIELVHSAIGYERSAASITFKAQKTDLADPTIKPITITKGSNTTITTLLEDIYGQKIARTSKISIKVDGKTQLSGVEITSGLINKTIDTQTLKSGNHKITLVIGENTVYNKKVVEVPLTVE